MMNTTYRTVRWVAAVAALGLSLTACGGSDSSSTASDAPAPATAAPAATVAPTTVAPVDTTAPADTTAPVDTAAPAVTAAPADSAAPADTAAAPAAATKVKVELNEWMVMPSTDFPAGMVEFDVVNTGNFPHEFLIVAGSYAELVQKPSGALDLSALPAGALLGEVETLAPGESGTLTVEVPAGRYTLICNLEGGGSSHAKRGQVHEIDVK